MKKIALVLSLALVACLALAGCQSETGGAGDPVPGGVTEPSVSLNENKNEIEILKNISWKGNLLKKHTGQ